MQRILLLAAAVNGFLAVALGAFGAHGLRSRLAALPDAAKRFEWWETASHYHLAHALALGVLAAVCRELAPAWARTAGVAFVVGVVLFSGSLYAMTLSGRTALGAITPLGGLALLVGWFTLALAAWRVVH